MTRSPSPAAGERPSAALRSFSSLRRTEKYVLAPRSGLGAAAPPPSGASYGRIPFHLGRPLCRAQGAAAEGSGDLPLGIPRPPEPKAALLSMSFSQEPRKNVDAADKVAEKPRPLRSLP
jgi:hypothetical protein